MFGHWSEYFWFQCTSVDTRRSFHQNDSRNTQWCEITYEIAFLFCFQMTFMDKYVMKFWKYFMKRDVNENKNVIL